jgi:hypothetical protein
MFGGDRAALTDDDLAELAGTVPTVEIGRAELEAGVPVVDLLARNPWRLVAL